MAFSKRIRQHSSRLIACFTMALMSTNMLALPIAAQDHTQAKTLDRLHAPLLRDDLQVKGAQSCAAASCHGGPRPAVVQPRVKRGNEFPLWLENDPHAQSWRTFCSDTSVAMMRRLKIIDAHGEVTDRAGYDNCLACHNSTPRYKDANLGGGIVSDFGFQDSHYRTASFQREGVGCSGCHGPSERWIGTHFQEGWDAEYACADGFVNTKDLLTRARMCATCHVGDQDRDMNHDIIAAGHPPLRYEFATFHMRQPKHWRDSEADAAWRYEAQLWLAGQVAAFDASLSLLIQRATVGDRDDTGPINRWPELAAYDCAACHHSLGFSNQRVPDQPSVPAAGAPIASAWNDVGMRWLLNYRMRTGKAVDQDFRLLDGLEQVRMSLQSDSVPNADVVAEAAMALRTTLAAWVDQVYCVERFEFESAELAQLVTMAAEEPSTYQTWESAAQYYLAAAAARNAWPDGASGPALLVANRLRIGLRYADETTTPRFAKVDPALSSASNSTLTRQQAAKLAVELAAWLGPVTSPDLSHWDADRNETKRLKIELQSVIEKVNDTLKRRRAERSKQQQEDLSNPQSDNVPPSEKSQRDAEPEPKPRVKSRQELLDELRKRRAKDANPFGDD